MTRFQWPITREGLDMTLEELTTSAMEPGGPLDEALLDRRVATRGAPKWHIDSSRPEEPRLVCDVPVAPWVAKRGVAA